MLYSSVLWMFKYRDDNRVGQQTTLSADDNLGGQLIANFVLWMLKYILRERDSA